MKTKSRNFLITSLTMIVMMLALLFSAVAISPLTAFAQGEITVPTIVSVGGIEVDQETTMGGAPSALKGQPYSAQVEATGGDLTYSAGAGEYMNLPEGLTINAETGLISGTCTEETGRYNCLIKATNAMGEASVVIGITVGDSNCIPGIETAEGSLGQAYKNANSQFIVSATNNNASMSIYNFSWSIKSGALPDGMKLSYTSSRTVYITGAPTATGTFNFELEVRNDFGTASRSYSISVVEGSISPSIVASGDSLGYGVVGKPYEYQLEATGTNSNEDPMLWSTDSDDFSQESYDLGNGLSMSKTGLITGTPQNNTQVSFYVYAKNSVGTDGESFYILIYNNGDATSSTITPEVAVVAKGSSKEFTISLEGYGDVEQVAYWSFYMYDDELGSAFPQPTDSQLSVNPSTPSKTVTLTVGENETREQIRVVAYSKPGNGGVKTWATVTIVEKAAVIYNVSFDKNGGTGEMTSVPVVENDTYKLPACGFTAPTGYEFKCWSVNEVEKAVGDVITITTDITVKAVWKAKSNNIDAGSVSVNYKSFSASCLYYKNGADDVTNDSENYNAHFNPETNTLTLKNYEGDAIAIGGAIQKDVTIVLIGTNIITTNDQKAISSTNGGGILITAESEASLTINSTAVKSAIYGIYTGTWGHGILDISGYADVTINVNSTRNDTSVYGVYIDGTIDIKDNAKLTINTSSENTYSGYSVGMGLYAKQGITFNTTKKILVNTSGIPSENGNYGIYSDIKVDLKKAEELKIVVSAGSYATPVYPAANTQNWTGFQESTNVEAKVLTTTYTPIAMHTVTFNSNSGSGSMNPVEFAGEYTLPSCTITAPTGKQFKGWATSANGEVVGATYNVTADVEFFAIWEDITYTVTYTDGVNNVELFADQVNANITEGAATPAFNGTPAREGYTFAGWTPSVAGTVTANATYTATWTINQYTITFNTNGGSAIDPITQDYGTAVVAPSNPTKTGYTFAGWDKTIPSTMPAENMTITAQWTEVIPNTYTITYTDGVDNVELFADQVNANITEGAATPAFNGTPAREGYTFAGWTPSVAGTVTANATYTATWTINQYTITFNTDGGSAIDPITQNYGTAIVAPANPTKSGYTFTGWDKTIPSTMPAENITVTATWELIPVHTHDYGTTWQFDENNHWNECECGDKANTAPHADANNDGKCDICDYAMGNADNPGGDKEPEKTGLSGGAIAGIAVGSVAVAGLGGFSLFWFVIKKKKFADLIAMFKKK